MELALVQLLEDEIRLPFLYPFQESLFLLFINSYLLLQFFYFRSHFVSKGFIEAIEAIIKSKPLFIAIINDPVN